MEYDLVFIGYTIYLPIVILLTLYVAHILFRNANVFMLEIFSGKTEIALSTNKLFEVGFYLINIGFALLILKFKLPNGEILDTKQELMEVLSYKIGGFSIYLGVMMFLNLLMFFRGRRKAKEGKRRAVNPVLHLLIQARMLA